MVRNNREAGMTGCEWLTDCLFGAALFSGNPGRGNQSSPGSERTYQSMAVSRPSPIR